MNSVIYVAEHDELKIRQIAVTALPQQLRCFVSYDEGDIEDMLKGVPAVITSFTPLKVVKDSRVAAEMQFTNPALFGAASRLRDKLREATIDFEWHVSQNSDDVVEYDIDDPISSLREILYDRAVEGLSS